MNEPLVVGGNVDRQGFAISPDSSRVVYMADQETDDVIELFSVSITGGETIKLNGELANGGDVFAPILQISPDSSPSVMTPLHLHTGPKVQQFT